MPAKDKEKWEKILRVEVMSSDESSSDSEDNFVVKVLTWRHERVNYFLRKLDEKSAEIRSSQAQRQRKKRIINGAFSSRPMPSGLPKWAITD